LFPDERTLSDFTQPPGSLLESHPNIFSRQIVMTKTFLRICSAGIHVRSGNQLHSGRVLFQRIGLLLLLLLSVMLDPLQSVRCVSGESVPSVSRYMIVTTGRELLVGAYADAHTHFLTRKLRPLGLDCVGSMSVDDKQEDIQEALRFATGRAPLVIVTGGLGPTHNDITRQAISRFTKNPLHEHDDLLRILEHRFKVSRDQLGGNLRRQAQVPGQGTYLKNAHGTAAGLVFEYDQSVIVALPGPPRELRPMVRDELIPFLQQRFGVRLPGPTLTLRFVGIGQSRIDKMLKGHAELTPDMIQSSHFERGRVDFTFSLPENTPRFRAQLQELKQLVMRHLGDYVYAADEVSLEEQIVSGFESQGRTFAIVEAGTGGLVTAGLSEVARAPKVLTGTFVAPSEEKLQRMLRIPEEAWKACASRSQELELLATSAIAANGSQCALVVGESRQDTTGVHYLEIAIKLPQARVVVQRVHLGGSGRFDRDRLVTRILNGLWRHGRETPARDSDP
jgi:nicotinamide-nucleotide amidase